MRCFIAVDLNSALKPKVTELQRQIRNYDVRLVEEHNLHFTLKFLGDVPDSTLTKVKDASSKIADSTQPFGITLKGVTLYPTEKYVRVVFVDTTDDKLLSLNTVLNDALAGLFKKEKVRPHLTLARARSSRDNKKLAEFAKRHKGVEIGSMRVDEIKLKKSMLTPKGPIYEDIAKFPLSEGR